jgi:hypothetical protein
LDTKIGERQVRPCDVRYALFYAHTDGERVTLRNLQKINPPR